ncbi:hypothetical protein GCM10022248_69540 [Nonomuraea soli]
MRAVAVRFAVVVSMAMTAAVVSVAPASAGTVTSCRVIARESGSEVEPGFAAVKCGGIGGSFQAVLFCGNEQSYAEAYGPWVPAGQISAAECPDVYYLRPLKGVGWNTWG